MAGASKIKNGLFAWLCALVITLCLSENCVGQNFSADWNEPSKIEASTIEGTKEIAFAWQYDASDYTIAPNTGGPSAKYQVLREKFDAYKGRGGQLSITDWAKRTRGQDWGIGNVKSGFGKSSRTHGNSLSATGAHDVYVIRGADTGRILHFGETGRGLTTRLAEHQRYYSQLGINIEATLLKTVDGKAAARALELRYIQTYTKTFGQRPLFNPVNH